MLAEIIRFNHDLVIVPTNNALVVPELKNLWKNVETPEIYFAYIHCMLFPTSAYSNLSEEEKEKIVHSDYPIDKTNPYFILAYNKCESLYETPIKRGFMASKTTYEMLVKTMEAIATSGNIQTGKDGNYGDVTNFLKNAKGYMDSYLEVENKYKEEQTGYASRAFGFDEGINYLDKELDLND